MRRLAGLAGVRVGLVAAAARAAAATSRPERRRSGRRTGTVTFFGYEDNFVPEVIDPFLEATRTSTCRRPCSAATTRR